MNKLNGIILSSITAAILAGCGGSSSSSSSGTTLSNVTYGGSVIDGYISGATVCLDLNLSGTCDSDEPSTTTKEDGSYSFSVTAQQQANANFNIAPIIASGGVDIDTGLDFEGKLEAPKAENANLTPITTLVSKLIKTEVGTTTKTKAEIDAIIAAKKEIVKKVLGVTNTDEDFISTNNSEINKAALQIQKTVELIAKAANDGSKAHSEVLDKVIETIAKKIESLKDETDATKLSVSNVVDETITEAQDSSSELATFSGKVLTTSVTDNIKKVSNNIDLAFDSMKVDGESYETLVNKVISLVGTQIDDLKDAIENDTVEDVELDEYTKESTVFTKTADDLIKDALVARLVSIGFDSTVASTKATALLTDNVDAKNLFEVFTKSEYATIQTKYPLVKTKVDAYLSAKEEAKKAQEILSSSTALEFKEGTYYSFNKDEYTGTTTYSYEVLNFANGTVSFKPYNIDGTEQTDNNSDLVFDGTNWVEDKSSISYTKNSDNTITLSSNEKFTKISEYDLSNKEIYFGDKSVEFSSGAIEINGKVEKLADTYYLYDQAYIYANNEQQTAKTFADYKTLSAENKNWFTQSENGKYALAFVKDGDNVVVKEFYLTKNSDGYYTLGNQTGVSVTIEDKKLSDNVTVYILKGYDLKRYSGDWLENIIFSEYNGAVYRGSMEPKGTVNQVKLYNEIAKNDFVTAVTTTDNTDDNTDDSSTDNSTDTGSDTDDSTDNGTGTDTSTDNGSDINGDSADTVSVGVDTIPVANLVKFVSVWDDKQGYDINTVSSGSVTGISFEKDSSGNYVKTDDSFSATVTPNGTYSLKFVDSEQGEEGTFTILGTKKITYFNGNDYTKLFKSKVDIVLTKVSSTPNWDRWSWENPTYGDGTEQVNIVDAATLSSAFTSGQNYTHSEYYGRIMLNSDGSVVTAVADGVYDSGDTKYVKTTTKVGTWQVANSQIEISLNAEAKEKVYLKVVKDGSYYIEQASLKEVGFTYHDTILTGTDLPTFIANEFPTAK